MVSFDSIAMYMEHHSWQNMPDVVVTDLIKNKLKCESFVHNIINMKWNCVVLATGVLYSSC